MEHNVVITPVTGWNLVYSLALATAGRKPKDPVPTVEWRKKMLKAMHSPIRGLMFMIEMTVPYWVSVHFVRHNIGVQHFVQSQRTDRTGEERDKKPQDEPVRHTMLLNAEAIINISRKRLCGQASPETRKAWVAIIAALKEVDPVLAPFCVPECIHQGFCTEFKCCGRISHPKLVAHREKYVKGFLTEEGDK